MSDLALPLLLAAAVVLLSLGLIGFLFVRAALLRRNEAQTLQSVRNRIRGRKSDAMNELSTMIPQLRELTANARTSLDTEALETVDRIKDWFAVNKFLLHGSATHAFEEKISLLNSYASEIRRQQDMRQSEQPGGLFDEERQLLLVNYVRTFGRCVDDLQTLATKQTA